MSFLVYLLKVTIASGIFFGYYRLFLCNKKFHHYNRFFLISALVLSIALPFIRIPVLFEPENPVHKVVYRTVSMINTDYYEPATGPSEVATFSEPVFTLMNAIYLVYAVGAVILLTLITRSLIYIRSIRKKYRAENITSLKFYNTREPGTPFSFFRSIFWNDQLEFNSQEGQQIFRHELFHVQHHHSIDRLLTEFVTAVFWFNPFFHLIKRELRAIHEFLADQFAIDTHGSDRYTYATLLVQQALESGKHRVTNHFFQNHIKRRIAMITQFKQSNYGYWSRVMILPVSLLLFCFITLYAKKPAMANTLNFAAVIEKSTNALTDVTNGGNEPYIQEIIHFNDAPGGDQRPDTIPDKKVRERQLRQDKEKEMHMQQLRQKMMLREMELKKKQEAQLDQLKQQMQSQEKLELEMTELKKMREQQKEEFLRELKNRQMILQKERLAANEEMKAMMKQLESQKDDGPEAEKIRRAKIDELRQKMEDRNRAMQDRAKDQEHEMKQKMKEIESMNGKLMELSKRQREEMMEMRRKFQDRERELRQQHQQNLIRQKEQLKKMELEQRENERNEKENKKQISGIPGKYFLNDSLFKLVVRSYNRNIRYPHVAINNQTEGEVYFSVVVGKEGIFKDYKTYQVRPAVKDIPDLVIVGFFNGAVAVSDPDPTISNYQLFANEMKRATDWSAQKPIPHPEERLYYFRAVFRIEGKKERDNNILLTSNAYVPAKPVYGKAPIKVPEYQLQDTIPLKKRAKVATKEAKPTIKNKPVGPAKNADEKVLYKVTTEKPAKKPAKAKLAKVPTMKRVEKFRVEKTETKVKEKPARVEKEAPRKPATKEEKEESNSNSNSSSSSSSSSSSNSNS